MLIIAVQVRPLAGAGDMVQGVVELLSDHGGIYLTCRARAPETPAGGSVQDRLIRDAVRQLRRMPEFRAGHGRFAFAPGLLNAS
ncbi:MAG: hypothetical protein KDK26_11175 [Roseivivax sp.]|nr:hypothetical protein [Roseivivax sp.]